MPTKPGIHKQTKNTPNIATILDPEPAPAPAPVTTKPPAAPKAKTPDARLAKVITVLAPSNPKKANTKCFKRFAIYKTGMTVADYLKAGGQAGDVLWDAKHKFISLS